MPDQNEYTPPTARQTSAMYNEAAEHLEKARDIILLLWEAAPLNSAEDGHLESAAGHTAAAGHLIKYAGQRAKNRLEPQA